MPQNVLSDQGLHLSFKHHFLVTSISLPGSQSDLLNVYNQRTDSTGVSTVSECMLRKMVLKGDLQLFHLTCNFP